MGGPAVGAEPVAIVADCALGRFSTIQMNTSVHFWKESLRPAWSHGLNFPPFVLRPGRQTTAAQADILVCGPVAKAWRCCDIRRSQAQGLGMSLKSLIDVV